MHKIFSNMLTDEWKNFKKSRDELKFQGKKKRGGDDVDINEVARNSNPAPC